MEARTICKTLGKFFPLLETLPASNLLLGEKQISNIWAKTQSHTTVFCLECGCGSHCTENVDVFGPGDRDGRGICQQRLRLVVSAGPCGDPASRGGCVASSGPAVSCEQHWLGRAVQLPPSREALRTSRSHSGAYEEGGASPEVVDGEGKKEDREPYI